MSLITRILVVFLFIIGGCFPFVTRKKKMRCRRRGNSCSCTDYQTSSQESIESIDSMSVVEPTTWQMPPKGRKRTRTISGASNFSGTSTMSTLNEKDRMWLQAFRYAGRWESWLEIPNRRISLFTKWIEGGNACWETAPPLRWRTKRKKSRLNCYFTKTDCRCVKLEPFLIEEDEDFRERCLCNVVREMCNMLYILNGVCTN